MILETILHLTTKKNYQILSAQTWSYTDSGGFKEGRLGKGGRLPLLTLEIVQQVGFFCTKRA